MSYSVIFHHCVEDDLAEINKDIAVRILNAIQGRLSHKPESYGAPLRHTLKGYWKLRVGDYRVVYKVVGSEVIVIAIAHRRFVYKIMAKRA